MRAANDNDHVGLPSQFHGGVLPLFGRLANGIGETHFGIREAVTNQLDQMPYFFNRLGGLSRDPEARTLFQAINVAFGEHHVEVPQILRHSPHFDMVPLADNDWMITLAYQFSDGSMGK